LTDTKATRRNGKVFWDFFVIPKHVTRFVALPLRRTSLNTKKGLENV
jgi:hypothetical protein